MTNQPDSNDPKERRPRFWSLILLPLAIAPTVGVFLISMSFTTFVIVNAVLSVVAGWGIWNVLVRNRKLRGFLALSNGIAFFLINSALVTLIGTFVFLTNTWMSFQGGCSLPNYH